VQDIYLSVVIPAFNEEKRIGPSLSAALHFLKAQPYSSEVILVDDGSVDDTMGVAQRMLNGFPHRLLKNDVNIGKGSAVKKGVMASSGQYVLFSDADMSTPIEEVNRLLQAMKDGYDLVIGSRALSDSRVEIHQSTLRESMGRIFNLVARFFSFKGIQDSQCGFKCFSRDAAKHLFGRQKIHGFSFDAEILYLAQKKSYRILEMPVLWRNSPQSRVRIMSDSLAMLIDLVKIRWLHRNS